MIVDVIDLDFESLKFKNACESSRYERARKIYNNERVDIGRIDMTAHNEYDVEAVVDGNYENCYTVNLEIKDNLVVSSDCECQDSYNGFICKHIIATYLELKNPHSPTTLDGRKRYEEQRKIEAQKQFEAYKQRLIEERKAREYEYKYRYGLSTLNMYKPEEHILDTANNLDLNNVYQRALLHKNEKKVELSNYMMLEPTLELIDIDKLKLSFKIGQSKMYVLKNLMDFYEAYKYEDILDYGKMLRFVPNRENFSDDSKKYFDFIVDYADIVNLNKSFNRYGSTDGLPNKDIYISGNRIEEFFDLMSEPKVWVKTYGGQYTCYKFTEESINIKCIMTKEKYTNVSYYSFEEDTVTDEHVFKLNINNYHTLISNNYIYIFYDNKIYKLEKEKELLRLLEMFNKNESILIPEDKLGDFAKYVIPNNKYMDTSNLPEEIVKEGSIVNKLAAKMLLDIDDEGNILLELKFCYDEFEFNILDVKCDEYAIRNSIVRDIPAEESIVTRIFNDGFELLPNIRYFVLKNLDNIYDFLSLKIEKYMNDFEILVTDKFKSKQIRQPKISSIGVKVDNNLLEIDFSKVNIDIDEIKDILKDYRIKKKYHKLKDGEFLNLDGSSDLKLLDEMATSLDIDYSQMSNGKINLPVNRSIYLNKILGKESNVKLIKNDEFAAIVDSFEGKDSSCEFNVDAELDEVLRDYQKTGYRWLKTLEHYKFGGILADDMGLGKTLQIIAVLKDELKSSKKTISAVICPSTLVLNWKAEIEKWCGDMKVLVIKGTSTEREELIQSYADYDVLITSYDLLKRDIDKYDDICFKFVIADEAQYIKNFTTQNATALKSLRGEIKYALTGTPIENSVAELWSIFDFIMPGYLYNYGKFKKKFEIPILKLEDQESLKRLKKLISPFILRRTKKEVLTELPDKNITIMKNEMEDEQYKIYLSYLAQTKKEVAEELNTNSFEKSKFKILMLLTRLRQICCHPSLFIDNYRSGSGKLNQCLDIINDAIEAGHKILLFSSYTSMFEIIEKQLNKQGIKYFKLIGDTKVDRRIEMVDEFNNNNDIKVFLISLKSGGVGLNLTSADVVIHYDPWWNISSENQATDRAYRIGQKNSVQVYKLITSNSIEEKINKMQERKEKLSEDLLSTEETFISKMTKEEIMDLFE